MSVISCHPIRTRAVLAALGVLQALAWATLPAVASQANARGSNDVILYRVFLNDGTNAVSYGELARVAGNVVFSIPLGDLDSGSPQLQLVSLADAAVDWSRTEAYAQAARAKHFAETRGEAEFARLSEEVARTLGQIAFTADPARRLAAADGARRILAEWPARNYWYRAADVAELSALLDGVRSELRVAAGQSRFDLDLVANLEPPPAVAMLPAPVLRESVEQAFALARLSQEPAQRSSLLRAIAHALAGAASDGGWAAALRARANADLIASERVDRAYADLSARMLKTSDDKVRRGDVKGMHAVIRDVLKADDRLGRQRPQETAALLATLDFRLASARRARLGADQWSLRAGVVRAYDRRTRSSVNVLGRARSALEQIRELAGPSPKTLRQLETNAASAGRELALIKPPPEMESVHSLLTSAFQMAVRAAATRTTAISGNDMMMAWQASSAAAGALLMLDRAREEMRRLVTPPVL